MMLRNLNKKYVVIQEYLSGNDVHQYLCYEMGQAQTVLYTAVCQPLTVLRNEEIGFLTEQLKKEAFTDLVDYFLYDGLLVVLFSHSKGISLQKKMASEACSLQERLELAKGLLEKILLLQLSPFFFAAAMDSSLMQVAATGEVSFVYDCRNIAQFDQVEYQEGAKRLAEVLECLFEEELKQRSIQELYSFVYDLKHNGTESYLGNYERFWAIYQQYIQKKEEELEPYRLSFRIWDRIKSVGRFLKKLVKPALVLLALGYLVVSILGLFAEPGVNENFKQIGTVPVAPSSQPVGEGENAEEETAAEAGTEETAATDTAPEAGTEETAATDTTPEAGTKETAATDTTPEAGTKETAATDTAPETDAEETASTETVNQETKQQIQQGQITGVE